MHHFLLRALPLLVSLLGVLPSPTVLAYTFTTIQVQDAVLTEARGINSRGELVGFYADGQAGAIYGQWPPLVNASRKPGEWQTYDIAFEAPKFENGKLTKPGYATVFHNGILLHNRKEIIGAVAHREVGKYTPHGDEEPLTLQNHDTFVRYRNIWVRRLKPYDQP